MPIKRSSELHELNTGRVTTGLQATSSTSLDPSLHLIALYHTCVDLKQRIAMLELKLRSRDSSQNSQDPTPELTLMLQDVDTKKRTETLL